jgi:phage tail protein X
MRMDMLSYKYYGDPDYGWLILQANPSIPSMEYLIQDGTVIRIPYPLSTAISRYEQSINEYNNENE